MFENMIPAQPDPILGLVEEFKRDARTNKINLGAGIYKDEQGNTPILSSVKKAEARLVEKETTKDYLPISGTQLYAKAVQELVFGKQSALLADEKICTAQTPGGTGALRLAGEFINTQLNQSNAVNLWISDPTWANHRNIFAASGLTMATYRYYNSKTHTLNFEAMLADLDQAKAGDIVLLHACCHNPSGIDPTMEQWQQLAELCQRNALLPFFDFAYQGFSQGIEEDAAAIRLFAQYCPEMLIASSFSKNFGLYSERVGALSVVTHSSDEAETVLSQLKSIARTIYSNPPAHGSAVVTEILNNASLRAEWEAEVTEMRTRISAMRQLFVAELQKNAPDFDFQFITEQHGMFSFSGLTKSQVARLKTEFGVYIVDSGRISIAGMTAESMPRLCHAISAVLKDKHA